MEPGRDGVMGSSVAHLRDGNGELRDLPKAGTDVMPDLLETIMGQVSWLVKEQTG